MSWTGGARIFETVSEAIERREEVEISGTELASVLIAALRREGWDPQDYGVGGLDEDSIIREAMAEHGNVEKCHAEPTEHGGTCEEERGHYPATNHRDHQGRTWTNEEEVQ